jgi:ribosome-binding protein aMBF1 (putative translation factor)
MDSRERTPWAIQSRSTPDFVGNCPLAYYRQRKTIRLEMTKRRKQIQPRMGVEKAFGQAMRKARNKLKISQMTLEKATGLDRTFISDLERGIQGPSLVTVFRVAKGLEIDACALVEDTANSPLFVLPSDDR